MKECSILLAESVSVSKKAKMTNKKVKKFPVLNADDNRALIKIYVIL
jgi:hypothetical protein